jgi:phosphoribosylamine--glycine ligase
MKILIIGSGGREHALAWRGVHEGHQVLCAPGSAGMESDGVCCFGGVGVSDAAGILALARDEAVDFVLVGPEQPLVEGLADTLRQAGIATLGASGASAVLEGSKAVAKAFMERHNIPTARYVTVTTLDEGVAALDSFEVAPVVKASGLAAGKGVTVPESFDEARTALRACIEGEKFGEAGQTVVLEERMHGEELSFFAISDGVNALTLSAAQDHKRIFDGDLGPNTGGMGAYAPAPLCDEVLRERIEREIVAPTLAGLNAEGTPLVGVLFCGLMVSAEGVPRVIEYNVRFGDPETQPLMLGLTAPIMEHLHAAAVGDLRPGRIDVAPSVSVVMASAGYPERSTKGCPITGLDHVRDPEVKVFHAGTRRGERGGFETAGGRVLGVCARGPNLEAAIEKAYATIEGLSFEGAQVRRDIGAHARVK